MFLKKASIKGVPSGKNEKRFSVRVQLSILAITIAAVAVMFFLSNRKHHETMQLATEQFNQQQLILARSAAAGIEHFIADVGDDLLALSNFPAVQSMEPGILERMEVIYEGIPPQTSSRRLDKSGILRFVYPFEGWRKELIGRDYSGKACFQKAKQTGETFLSGLIINEAGERRMRLVRSVYLEGEKGVREFNGVVICSLDPKTLDSLHVSPVISGETGYAWLLDENSIFLAHHEKEFVGRDIFKVRMETNPELSYDAINSIQRQMMAGEEGVGRYDSGWHRGQSGKIGKLIAYTPVHVFDKVWSVAVCAPVAEMERITRKAYHNELYTLGFVVFILTATGLFFFIAFYRWSQSLKQEIEVRKQAEKRIVHLNGVLRAIRNVNQLITKVKDREKLLQGACDNLVKNREYLSAWVVLMKENGSFITSAQAGVETCFEIMINRLKSGEMTRCIREAIEQSDVVMVKNPVAECGDCPLVGTYADKARMVARLKYKDNIYGFLSVAISVEMVADEEELSLFDEVAGDISFALHNIEMEDKRNQTEEEIKKMQQYARGLIEASLDALVTISAKGKITDVNHATELITGIPRKELIGTDFSNYFTEPDTARKGYQQVFRDGYVLDYPLELKHRAGKVTPVLYNASVYKDAQGRVAGVFAAARDITKRKKTEEKLQKAYTRLKDTQSQLIQAEKMEAIGRMASGIAHEVKNPLGIILQAADFLEGKISKEQKDVPEVLDIIKENIERSVNIINTLVDFSKSTTLKVEPADINSILKNSLGLIGHRVKLKDVELILELTEKLPKVLVDKGKMEQVFINLFLNSIQAMPEGGKLFIRSFQKKMLKSDFRVGRRKNDGDYFAPEEEAINIEVEDTGAGISGDNLKKIFDPFFTTKEPQSGTGLGLSVTMNIIEMHNGILTVESKEGSGTKFTITLRKVKED